ncbi:MAG: STAS domain-containing protein [Sulfuricella denitrificans]|nr:STAS domain-containing protein [Sulfuricella denitrificans]
MQINVRRENGACRLEIEGELTIYHGPEFRSCLLENLPGCDETEISLAGVTELDTAGCQLLLAAKREGLRLGKQVRFVSHSLSALEVIEQFQMAAQLGDPLVIPAQR